MMNAARTWGWRSTATAMPTTPSRILSHTGAPLKPWLHSISRILHVLDLKALGEFGGYIGANATWIPNYGERYRSGEAISNAFMESAINQVVSKRMVKKQQMRWSPRGAHLLLQIRTRVLNDDLAGDFVAGTPPLMPKSDRQGLVA